MLDARFICDSSSARKDLPKLTLSADSGGSCCEAKKTWLGKYLYKLLSSVKSWMSDITLKATIVA